VAKKPGTITGSPPSKTAPPKDLFASTKVAGLMMVGMEAVISVRVVAGLFLAELV
jgi:hypothetical protein